MLSASGETKVDGGIEVKGGHYPPTQKKNVVDSRYRKERREIWEERGWQEKTITRKKPGGLRSLETGRNGHTFL